MASVINSNRPDQPLPQCRWLVDLTTANANVSTPILYNELLLSLSYGDVLTGGRRMNRKDLRVLKASNLPSDDSGSDAEENLRVARSLKTQQQHLDGVTVHWPSFCKV